MKENKKRPFVFTCTGMTLDGKISTFQRKQVDITQNDNWVFLQEKRVIADAVMVGGRTLLLDDPSLTVKTLKRQKQRINLGKPPQPIKVAVIADAKFLKTKGDFFDKGNTEKIIFTTKLTPPKKIREIKKKAKVLVLGKEKIKLSKALEILYKLGVKALMVEGGGELIYSLFKEDLIDEINLKIGNLIFGGRNAPTFCDGEGFTYLNAKRVKIMKVIKQKNWLLLKCKVLKN